MLLSFSESRPNATIQELARDASVPVSTAYRYVSLLKELGLLEEGPPSSYHVGLRILSTARAASATNNLADVALPIMTDLANQIDENVILVRMIADSPVCVQRVESRRAVRMAIQEPGEVLDLRAGASGKTLLAFLPNEQREEYLRTQTNIDPGSADRIEALRSELMLIAERGWATSQGEIYDGIWACSAAVIDPAHRDQILALSAAGPAYRIDEQRQKFVLERVRRAAKSLEQRIPFEPAALPARSL